MVAHEAWPVEFSHADAAPCDGYRITRLRSSSSHPSRMRGALSIIFLHGAGDGDGVDSWVKLWLSLLESLPFGTEILLPSGPLIKNFYQPKNAGPQASWYKITLPSDWTPSDGLSIMNETVEFGGIDEVGTALHRLIEQERARPGQQVALGGFSQGGAMALWAGITAVDEAKLLGIFSLSGYIPQPHKLREGTSAPPPMLLMHGGADSVIRPVLLDATVSAFHQRGWYRIEEHRFPKLGHKVRRDELTLLCHWLSKQADLGRSQILDSHEQQKSTLFGTMSSRL